MCSIISLENTIVAVPDQVSCRLDDETVLLDLKKGTYYGLNSVGSVIWDLIQQPQRVQTICSTILEQYDVDAATCQRDVLEVLKDLREAGLVVLKSAA